MGNSMSNAHTIVAERNSTSEMISRDVETVTEWKVVRKAIDDTKAILHQRTFKWLATLPAELRPMETARKLPRIANRICDLWPKCEYTRLYFQSLLIDRRGGRAGLPDAIKREIEALQHYYFVHVSRLPDVIWNAVPVKEPKIPEKVYAPFSQNDEIEMVALDSRYAG